MLVDATTGFQGLEPLHQRGCHFGIAPASIDLRQLITQPAVPFHLPWVQIPGAGSGLQGHGGRGDKLPPILWSDLIQFRCTKAGSR